VADTFEFVSDSPSPHSTRRVVLIGIGPGGSHQLTLEAADALGRVDVFVRLDKGREAAELAEVRRKLIAQYAGPNHRLLSLSDTQRDSSAPYSDAVGSWHAGRTSALERLLIGEVEPGELVGILVWGDPSLYDSAIRLLDRINDTGALQVEFDVIAGVSSVQLLAARHRIVLNRVGGSVLITTGRRLAESGLPAGVDDVVVMLDGDLSFRRLADAPLDIYWGAYLGMEGELLVAGDLAKVAEQIVEMRAAAREQRGWIFDVYLLRRRAPD
jgi:precorrin-6A synthase